MAKIIKKSPKRLISILTAVALIAGMIPVSMLFRTYAAVVPVFSFEIDSTIRGDISISLTNSSNPAETLIEPVIDGKAIFRDFVDRDNDYDVVITGMIGYEDYYESDVSFKGESVLYAAAKFVPSDDVIEVSGRITDENNNTYTEGGTVTYSVYKNGSVDLGHDGTFRVTIKKDTPYNFEFKPNNPKYNPVSWGFVNSSDDVTDLDAQLTIKTFSITTSAEGNGTISPSEHLIPYGSYKNVTAVANPGHLIESFTVDGSEVSEAVGKETHTYHFNNIDDDHEVVVKFAIKTYEVKFTFNSNGTITDALSNNINNGGRIIANEGDSPSFTAKADANYHISSVIIDYNEQTDGTFDNDQTTYSHTFTNISTDHDVVVRFLINTYDISISSTGNGSVTIGNSPAGSIQKVSHGGSLTLTLTPEAGNDVKNVFLDGVSVEEYNLVADNDAYTYTIPSIESDHDVSVVFSMTETLTGTESDYYDFVAESLISGYPIVSDGIRVYNFKNDDASITFKPKYPYSQIRFNYYGGSSSIKLTNSFLINCIEVYKDKNPGKGWKLVPISEKLQIIIDKKAPVIDHIPPMDWTNQDYTINGKVTDEDIWYSPSSGLSRVVWSKTALTKAQVLAEETNIITVEDGMFSLAITTEQNNEKYFFYAIDNADNVSDAKTVDVKIDKTKPEITEFAFRKKEMPFVLKVINFLTFGTFFNDEIEVEVFAQDHGISSGLKEITLYSDEVAVETKTVTGTSAVFTLTLEDFNYNEISASVKDTAGNDSASDKLTRPTDVKTNAFSNIVGLKNEKPIVSIVPMSEPIYTEGDKKWYNDSVAFSVYGRTESAGLYSVEIKVNGKSIETDINGKAINANFFESQTLQENFIVSTDLNPMDGENNIEVIVTNNYGNEETASIKVFIDKTNPRVIGFDIDEENGGALSKIFNFLTFGIFFNEKVKITVIADDRYGATSGISTITLYADGKPIAGSPKTAAAIGDGTYKAEFVLPERDISDKESFEAVLAAVATDNVYNITGKDKDNPNGVPIKPDAVNSSIKSSRLMLETRDPVINISYPKPVFSDEKNDRKWYSGDVVFQVTAKDVDSGIRFVKIRINGDEITEDVDGRTVGADFYKSESHEEVFRISTRQGKQATDGSYLIEVEVTDNAGNKHYSSDIVYKDTDIPTITGLSFIPETSDGISETSEFINHLEYGFYFKTDFTTVVHVSDQKPSSGLGKISYRLVPYQNGTKTEEKNGTQSITDGMAQIAVPKGFKGQIFVKAFDNTGNESSEETPGGFVSDDTPPEINIKNNDHTNYVDANGNKLYVTDMSFTVTISDYDSGIKEIGYSQSAENISFDRKSTLIDNTGCSIGDILENGWQIIEMDHNLVTKVTKTFPFSTDDNDIILTFDAADRSGNKEGVFRTETITIDKTAPIINVEFRPDESKNNYYYNANRIADVTVIERNFDSSLIIAAIENKFGKVPTFSFTQRSITEYTAVIDFDEGDYLFDIKGTDLGNQPAIVNFKGGNEKLFYVDKTKPVIEENFAAFSNNAANNSFNTDKTATIKITEHNFDPGLVDLKIYSKGAGADHSNAGFADITSAMLGSARWESVGDVHTISLTFSKDAVYKIEMAPKDLAGNSTDLRSTVAFEIDKTPPVVKSKNGNPVSQNNTEFVDVYSYSRKDAPAPSVEFDDVNIDHIKYDLTVYIPDHTSEEALTVIRPVKVYLDEDKNRSGRIRGSKFTLPNFEKDGVYALELTAVDVAGNESQLNVNTYARMIEQDVLAYIMESNLKAKTGLYSFQYENGDAISKRPDNFSDIKICAFAKKDTGVDVVLRDNNADEINTDAKGTTDGSIYGINIHNLVLESRFFKEKFQDDTDIELHLTVKNEGNRIDLGTMHIDNIAPACDVPEEFKSWHWYYGEEDRTITISNISEKIDENRCKVYDNGKELDFTYLSNDNALSFTIKEGWHDIGIILVDMAGNVNNVQEKKNIHVGFFWLWIILASSAAVIIAIAFVVIRNIRKKRKLENDMTM